MKAPLSNSDYPMFFKMENKLLAFVAKDVMFKIEPIGSNTNPGVTIDHYVTRKMVLRHFPRNGVQLSREEFEQLFLKLYKAYLHKIITW